MATTIRIRYVRRTGSEAPCGSATSHHSGCMPTWRTRRSTSPTSVTYRSPTSAGTSLVSYWVFVAARFGSGGRKTTTDGSTYRPR